MMVVSECVCMQLSMYVCVFAYVCVCLCACVCLSDCDVCTVYERVRSGYAILILQVHLICLVSMVSCTFLLAFILMLFEFMFYRNDLHVCKVIKIIITIITLIEAYSKLIIKA